jgi:hypothetical protein
MPPENLQRQSFTFCAVILTQALAQKLLGKGAIMAMEKAYKSLAD